ncbi:MAG: glycosyltransferase family 4 protein [Gammaproteobacteria bacterium]|nr:glycosyltransferase family 4 protein [Gammaproteobacteria bacterium]
MNIGFDAKRAFHNFRGLGNYSRNLIQGLIEGYPDHRYFAFTPEFKDPRVTAWREKIPDLDVVRPEGFISKKIPALWRSQLVIKDLMADNIDLYHGLHHELPTGLRQAGIKSVVTVHDVLFLRFPQFHSKINRMIYTRKLKSSCNNADVVIAISEQTKQDLIDFLQVPEEKIQVVYQSCEPLFFNEITSEQEATTRQKYKLPDQYLLYVGALTPSKNLENLLRAYYKLQANEPEVHLVIAGMGGLEKALKQQSADWNISEKVHFPGFIDNTDLPALFKAATIFVYPSLFEGFGIPIIEALASGTPVITSTDSCFAEAGGPGSKYVNPQSVDQLSSEIKTVLASRELRTEMIEQGKAHVQQFHPSNTTRNMMSLYQDLGRT